MKFQFDYICISVTSKCNLSCKYCYRFDSNTDFISKQDFTLVLKFLKKMGVKTINITGGEPYLHPDLDSLINIAWEYKFYIILSTNGVKVDLDSKTLQKVNLLVISLDGSNEMVHAQTRGEGSFFKICQLIESYKAKDYPFKLKVNTVATKYNYDNLDVLAQYLSNKNIYWRIFYCKQKGNYNLIDAKKCISKPEFREKVCKLQEQFGAYFLSEIANYDIDNELSYSIINADCDLFISNGETTEKIGNILSLSLDRLKSTLLRHNAIPASYKGKNDY